MNLQLRLRVKAKAKAATAGRLVINNADNHIAAFVNGEVIYNRHTAGDPTFEDVTPFTLNPGDNFLALVGFDWGGPAHFKGRIEIEGYEPIEFDSRPEGDGLVWGGQLPITV